MIERQIENILSQAPIKKRSALAVEIASSLSESQRKVDTYFYYIKEERLYSPTHKMPVCESTISKSDKDLVEQIENWAKTNQEGVAVWISPPLEEGESQTKLTLLEIMAKGQMKMVKNQSVLLDIENEKLQEMIDYVVSFSINPNNELNLYKARYNLIIIYDKSVLNFLSSFFQESWESQKKRIQEAARIAKLAYTDINQAKIIFSNNIGSNPLSCPTIGIGLTQTKGLFESAVRFLECTCPFCKNKVRAKIENGRIHCPHCGMSSTYLC
jgi:hypothetical protein